MCFVNTVTQARSECHLKYLIGASVGRCDEYGVIIVVYGLPVTCKLTLYCCLFYSCFPLTMY